MASSTHYLLNWMVHEIIKTKPETVLDVGIGYGKYGFLIRDFIEVHKDRVYPEQWQIKIDGIEIWEPFIKRLFWLKIFYDDLYFGDAYDLIDDMENYDLIILGDVIEHMDKKRGQILLEKCIKKAKKCCILSIPIGNWLHNKIVADNPYEEHKSIWYSKELIKLGEKELGHKIKTYVREGIKGNDAIFIFRKKEI